MISLKELTLILKNSQPDDCKPTNCLNQNITILENLPSSVILEILNKPQLNKFLGSNQGVCRQWRQVERQGEKEEK